MCWRKGGKGVSEQREPYIINQAIEIVRAKALREREQAAEQLRARLGEALARFAAMPECQRFLVQKFGLRWQYASVATYSFPGDIALHSAICQVSESSIETALVYQCGEVFTILSPEKNE